MKKYSLDKMKLGWFIGNFEPSSYRTGAFEVACKKYVKGDYEKEHVHKIAAEITLIADGHVSMNGVEYTSGDIIVLEPGEPTCFQAIEDTMTYVVKIPGATGDKYSL